MKLVRLCIKIIGLIAVAVTLSQCTRKSEPNEPVERVDATTLKVYKDALDNLKFAKASVMDFPEQLYLMGKVSVTEDRTTVVPARVAGRTESIYFASGEYVKAGQLLMTLFSPDFVAAKEEYLQALKQAKLPTGGADASDFSNLALLARKKLQTMGLTPKDVDGLADSGSSATSGASATKDALLTIRAPVSGFIVAKSAVLGNLVNVGDTLFTIGDLSKMWFSGDIYPEDLPKVKKGQDVVINVEGLNKPVYGKISFISPIVDPNTRSIKVRALMDNPSGYLRADMYVQGNVTISKNKALLVPTVAVVRGPDGYFAFKRLTAKTIEASEASVVFKKVPVKMGADQAGMTAIVSGLEEGDEVVTDGAWLLDAALNTEKK